MIDLAACCDWTRSLGSIFIASNPPFQGWHYLYWLGAEPKSDQRQTRCTDTHAGFSLERGITTEYLKMKTNQIRRSVLRDGQEKEQATRTKKPEKEGERERAHSYDALTQRYEKATKAKLDAFGVGHHRFIARPPPPLATQPPPSHRRHVDEFHRKVQRRPPLNVPIPVGTVRKVRRND